MITDTVTLASSEKAPLSWLKVVPTFFRFLLQSRFRHLARPTARFDLLLHCLLDAKSMTMYDDHVTKTCHIGGVSNATV